MYNYKVTKEIHDKINEFYLEYSSRKTYETSERSTIIKKEIEKLFSEKGISFPKLEYKTYYGFSKDSYEELLSILKKQYRKLERIEKRQDITDSVLDEIIDKERNDFIGTHKFMYGHLSDRERSMIREVGRTTFDLGKLNKK